MLSTVPDLVDAARTVASPAAGTPAGTVVLRACGLRVRGGGTVVAGDCAPLAGELAVFCRPVVTAPAVVRRDGTVQAGAWLPDLVRLGELERHLGDGVVEAAVDAAIAGGRLKTRQRRRLMSYPLVIRLMLAMALMPDASYRESLARLAGVLTDIPFVLEWHVPTEKVVTEWRLPVPGSMTCMAPRRFHKNLQVLRRKLSAWPHAHLACIDKAAASRSRRSAEPSAAPGAWRYKPLRSIDHSRWTDPAFPQGLVFATPFVPGQLLAGGSPGLWLDIQLGRRVFI